jgi:glycosyltransferase involved in cell wall biosynthesis
MMRVNMLKNTSLDYSRSMRIYSSNLVHHLRKLNGLEINEMSIKGTKLPFIKDILSKDLFYPIYARLKEGNNVNHITDHSYGALAYLLDPKKTIVTCHDLAALELPQQSSWSGRKRFLYNLYGMLKADNIIAVSESTKASILKHFNYTGNIHVVYNGIDNAFRRIKDKEEIVRFNQKYGLEDSFRHILHIGHHYPNKNVEMILNIIRDMPDCKLVKVGGFSEKQRMMIKTFKIGSRIIQLRDLSIPDLVKLYNSVDLLLFPSLIEGFGFPVAEAMACGCPVICSNTSSLPEVGGEAAYYIDPYDKKSIIHAVNEVLSDNQLRKDMVKKGFKQSQKFSWDRCAREVNYIYHYLSKH